MRQNQYAKQIRGWRLRETTFSSPPHRAAVDLSYVQVHNDRERRNRENKTSVLGIPRWVIGPTRTARRKPLFSFNAWCKEKQGKCLVNQILQRVNPQPAGHHSPRYSHGWEGQIVRSSQRKRSVANGFTTLMGHKQKRCTIAIVMCARYRLRYSLRS